MLINSEIFNFKAPPLGVHARRGNEPGPSRPPPRGTVGGPVPGPGWVAGGPMGQVPLSAKAEANLEALKEMEDQVGIIQCTIYVLHL